MKQAAKPGGVINVFVADCDGMLCQLLAKAMGECGQGILIRGFATDPAGFFAGLAEKPVDVVIMGPDLGGRPGMGFQTLRKLRISHPHTRVIMLLGPPVRADVIAAFRAGADGIFSRDETFEMLRKCIHAVYAGQVWASSEQLHFVVEALASGDSGQTGNMQNLLTEREQEMVNCVAEGLTNRQISQQMGITEHTVRNYLFRIFNKLGTSNRLELALYVLKDKEKGMLQVSSGLPVSDTDLEGKSAEHTRLAAAMLRRPRIRRGVPSDH
jgi:DNA-binding NarL/FixJ family response regulator